MEIFRFKQFSMSHQRSPFKVGTDSILLGAVAPVDNISRVLDIGTGCGIIALMLLQRGAGSAVGIEMDPEAAAEAKENMQNSRWNKQTKIIHGDFREENLIETLGIFNLIVSNPPFFSNSLKSPNDRKNISRHNNTLPFDILVKHAVKLLSAKGSFCVILPTSEVELFLAITDKYHLFITKRYHICSKPNTPEIRQILFLDRNSGKEPEEHCLVICNTDNSYSKDYIELTKNFYLDF